MIISADPGSATIYQFPVGGRSKARSAAATAQSAVASPFAPQTALCVDSWYHQAAILEAEAGKAS